ncbi:MAG: tyrosine-type recombinase/integrase, partial [Burkholderiales bacterium]|nr:tyrosine-type recombinase/integrase [Burkholderiales bacterium]
RLIAEVREQIKLGTFDYAASFPDSLNAPAPTAKSGEELFFDLIDRWWNLLELKASTKKNYRNQKENFWKKHLPNKPIKAFVYSDIKEALKKGTWKSNKSRNNQLSIIRSVFDLAVKDKQIKENPCEGLEYTAVQSPGPDPFSLQEVRKILDDLAKHYSEQILNYMQFQFFTGLRTSEAIALDWANVDLRKGEVVVEEVNVYDEDQDSTKTSTIRIVKLPVEALAALHSQRKHTTSGKVFHDPLYNEPWAYSRITDAYWWPQTLKRLHIRYRRMYNSRHTFATIGLMAGANPAYMARQLGHSLEMFFRVYAKWIDGKDDDRELAKIQAAINASA